MDSLVDELLLEIFEYLDANTVKTSSLVCKRYIQISKSKMTYIALTV